MKIFSVQDVSDLVKIHGFEQIIYDLMVQLKRDFKNWDEHTQMPRPAMHVEEGVLELMPICDDEYYSFKYVNCHPRNPLHSKITVVATGQLSDVVSGYPLMFSEMTVLTALRTAATAAIATDAMARDDSKVMAIIGTGAQSEFQARATRMVRNVQEIRFFDIDKAAMDKFAANMKQAKVKLVACKSAEEAVRGADIVTVCTACKQHVDVIKSDWIKSGVHINALGGDTIGKTELDVDLLRRSRIVVEYFDQTITEGEIQRLSNDEASTQVIGQLHELLLERKQARKSDEDITIFDSVGIALQDFSALKLVYVLSDRYGLGRHISMVPGIADPKDLISLVGS